MYFSHTKELRRPSNKVLKSMAWRCSRTPEATIRPFFKSTVESFCGVASSFCRDEAYFLHNRWPKKKNNSKRKRPLFINYQMLQLSRFILFTCFAFSHYWIMECEIELQNACCRKTRPTTWQCGRQYGIQRPISSCSRHRNQSGDTSA